jgi:hypothetical protein
LPSLPVRARPGRGEGPLAQGQASGSGVYVDAVEVSGYIEDNGKAKGGVSVDRTASEPPQPPGAFDAAAGVCTDPGLNPAWTPLESGDFSVFDAG